jgi:hypothetical protein
VEFIPLDVPEEIMNWRDQRSFIKENDGRIKTISLDDEWYIVSKTNMKKCGIPQQRNNQGYIKWFEDRGYKPHTIVSKKQKRKFLIVYQFPDAIEKAQVILDSWAAAAA